MRINKLISVFLLAMLMGFSSQSFAGLLSMDGEGVITQYAYTTVEDPLSGAIGVGDSFSSMTIFDLDTANDSNPDDPSIGYYSWVGDLFGTTGSLGSLDFSTDRTNITIFNDYNGMDLYRIGNWGTLNGDNVLFNIYLVDKTAQVFDSDDFVLEPSLNGFDEFTAAYFLIRNWDIEGNLNYLIRGDLTSFVDPEVVCDDNQCVSVAVPAPNTILLLGLGLIAVFFASKSYRREDKFTV